MTRDEAVVSYLAFAKSRARRWGNIFPSKRPDIEATALLALVKAFDNFIPPTDIERRKYLTVCIRNAINDFFVTDKLIPIPKSELARLKEANEEPLRVIVASQLHQSANMMSLLKKTRSRHYDRLRFEELLERLQMTHRDLQIVHCIMDGYTQQETAELVGVSQSLIAKTLQKLAKRYRATS